MAALPSKDLAHILTHTGVVWPKLKGARIFITGGTGFVGKWLVETIAHANRQQKLGIKIVVLTRDPERCSKEMPHWAKDDTVTLLAGDVRNFAFPEGEFTHVIHAATDVAVPAAWVETYEVIVNGTKRVLDFCREKNVRDVLLLSSGAVYGRQDPELSHVAEDHATPLDTKITAYAQGKRVSEWLGNQYNAEYGLRCRIARCFAFLGPHLPLNGPFAVGNFIADVARGKPIEIKGDGTALRSYLYAADLVIWLLTIFISGEVGVTYNVGSDEAISIKALAEQVAQLHIPPLKVNILTAASGKLPERYIPSIRLAEETLGLKVLISLDDGLKRMLNWVQSTN